MYVWLAERASRSNNKIHTVMISLALKIKRITEYIMKMGFFYMKLTSFAKQGDINYIQPNY